jgi:hypothetical protein
MGFTKRLENGALQNLSINEIKMGDRLEYQQKIIDELNEKNKSFEKNMNKFIEMKTNETNEKTNEMNEILQKNEIFKRLNDFMMKEKEENNKKIKNEKNENLKLKQEIKKLKEELSKKKEIVINYENLTLSNSEESQEITQEKEKSEMKESNEETKNIIEDTPPDFSPPPPPMIMKKKEIVLPKIPKIETNLKLKTFQYTSIKNNKILETIFNKNKIIENSIITTTRISNDKKIKEKFESLFSEKIIETVIEKSPRKKELVTKLNMDKSRNISIILKNIKESNFEILSKAIIELDDDVLDKDSVSSLCRIVPKNEELEGLISSYQDETDLENIPISDSFYLSLKNVKNCKQRLDCWEFKNQYYELVSNIIPDIEILRDAAKELKESKLFSELLGDILAYINFLNHQNSKGNKTTNGKGSDMDSKSTPC